MATDLERLVVQLSADIKGYENALRRAQGVTTRQARTIESRFAQMNSRLASSAASLGRRMAAGLAAGLTVGTFVKFSDAATRIDNALKVAGLSGAELEKVYDRLRASAIKNAAPIEALVELYGRAALVQKELGITGQELLGFTDKIAVALRVSGKSAAESSGALLQLSQALGSGVVRAEEFNSILEGALPIAQAAAAGLKEAGGSVAKLRQLVVDGKVSSEAFFRAFEAGSVILEQKVAGAQLTVNQSLGNLQTALIDAAREFNTSTGASERFANGINNVATAISNFDISGFIGKIQQAGGALDQFLKDIANSDVMVRFAEFMTGQDLTVGAPINLETVEAEKDIANIQRDIRLLTENIERNKALNLDTTDAQMQVDILLRKVASLRGAAADRGYAVGTPGDPNALGQRSGGLAPAKAVKPVSLGDFKPPSDDDDKKKKARESEFAREVRQIKERTAALQAETAAIAALNPLVNDYGFALEKVRAVHELLNAAQRAGLEVTPELKAQIDQLAEGYANAGVEAEKLFEELDRQRETFEFYKDTTKEAASGIVQALEDGKVSWSELGDVAVTALNRIIDKMLNDLIDAIYKVIAASKSGGGAGILGGLLGMGGGGGIAGAQSVVNSGGYVGLYDKGGYTGPGGRKQFAGAVHKGEVVFNQDDVRRFGGPAALESLRKMGPMRLPGLKANQSSMFAPSLSIDARGADAGVEAKIEAAGRKIIEQIRKEWPINTARALPVIKRMGYQQ